MTDTATVTAPLQIHSCLSAVLARVEGRGLTTREPRRWTG